MSGWRYGKTFGKSRALRSFGRALVYLLPFHDLSLVIVDEEHETSYKQYDPAPRYHARNAAIVLANMHGAKVLLGSATPSIESYHNALSGKYGLVELFTRYSDNPLPLVETVDLREQRKKKQLSGSFSLPLVEKVKAALQSDEQVILFRTGVVLPL